MTPEQIERVFGCSRLKMATGEHVEVFREAVRPGERRRYTKRFLETGDADFRQWTEREWRILARLIGHGIRCVPGVVRYDGGDEGGMRQVQTYDAGVTVDQWATLLPVARSGAVLRHVFEDCAHWWALAHHCIAALDEIHALQLVHLDIKADNICIPYAPTTFDPDASDGVRLRATFTQLALIDFAFSLVSRESLATALPIGWQKDYDYQSPRLLVALEAGRAGDLQLTQELDWRCDLYSLAAMLKRYLPDEAQAAGDGFERVWTAKRYDNARALIFRLRDCHDGDYSFWRPHRELMEITASHLGEPDLVASLADGWTLARDVEIPAAHSLVTPLTRIAIPLQTSEAAPVSPVSLVTAQTIIVPAVFRTPRARVTLPVPSLDVVAVQRRPRRKVSRAAMLAMSGLVALACPAFIGDPMHPLADQAREAFTELRSRLSGEPKPRSAKLASADSRTAAPTPVGPANPAAEREAVVGTNNTPAPDDKHGEDTSESRAQAPADSESADTEARAPEPPATSGGSAPVAEEPAARKSADSAASHTPFRKSAKLRGKPGEQTKRAGSGSASAPRPPQVARAVPPARDTSRSRTAIASPKPRQDVALSSTSPISPMSSARQAPMPPVARPVSTAPELAAAVAPSAAPQSAIRIDSPSETTTDSRGAASAAPAASLAQPSAPAIAPAIAPAPADSSGVDEARRTPSTRPGSEASKPPPVATTKPQGTAVATPRTVNPRPRDTWQETVQSVLKAFGLDNQKAAPVEERNMKASPSVAEPVRAPVRPAQAEVSAPESRAPTPTAAPTPAPVMPSTESSPSATPPSPFPAPVINPAPRPMTPPPARMLASISTTDDTDDALAEQARRMLSDSLPRVAAQARADATSTLWMAAVADHPAQSAGVINAAHGPWYSEQLYFPGPRDPVRARRLYEEAKWVFESGRTSDALNLGLRAFAADPRDSNIAGFLAILHLSVRPPQPETARQLALHALAFSGSRRSARAEDWDTLAIASALTGREVDATRALLVELAVTPDLHRSCETVQRAYATFGERLRVPVQAMLARMRTQRRDNESPACAWLNYQAFQTARRWQ